MNEEILKIHEIKKSFGDSNPVLDGISFEIKKGSITALIGANGSGKTTLLNLITGLLTPDEGDIYYKSQKITGKNIHYIANLGIGRLYQDDKPFSKMSLKDNIFFGHKNYKNEKPFANIITRKEYKKSESEIYKDADVLLKLTGLGEKADHLAEDLSCGQQKLVSIARLLAFDCDLMLLDEPFSGVDSENENQIKSVLKTIVKKEGLTILIIEHKMSIIREIADRAIYIDDGINVMEGDPEYVLSSEIVKQTYFGD